MKIKLSIYHEDLKHKVTHIAHVD